MTEETTPEILKHGVQFSRSVSDGNYGTGKAELYIQFSTLVDASVEEIVTEANERFAAAMAVVYDRLGISYDLNEDGNVVEIVDIQAATTPARIEREIQAAPAKQGDGSGAEGVGAAPPFAGSYKDLSKDENNQNITWAKARYATHPGEFWDNRSKENWSGPQITHKDSRVGFWVD